MKAGRLSVGVYKELGEAGGGEEKGGGDGFYPARVGRASKKETEQVSMSRDAHGSSWITVLLCIEKGQGV